VFLYKKFYELFQFAKSNDVHQEIITNSMLLNEKWIDEILNSNTKLAISIRSANKENYEKYIDLYHELSPAVYDKYFWKSSKKYPKNREQIQSNIDKLLSIS
jgi:hypothetical protein